MYVGVDLHKSTLNVAVMDEDGNLLREEKLRCEPERLTALSESHPTRLKHSHRELVNLVLGL
jgi:predicted NBD/HSP70 family sugar kinase